MLQAQIPFVCLILIILKTDIYVRFKRIPEYTKFVIIKLQKVAFKTHQFFTDDQALYRAQKCRAFFIIMVKLKCVAFSEIIMFLCNGPPRVRCEFLPRQLTYFVYGYAHTFIPHMACY